MSTQSVNEINKSIGKATRSFEMGVLSGAGKQAMNVESPFTDADFERVSQLAHIKGLAVKRTSINFTRTWRVDKVTYGPSNGPADKPVYRGRKWLGSLRHRTDKGFLEAVPESKMIGEDLELFWSFVLMLKLEGIRVLSCEEAMKSNASI